ncbi:hypothetical protein D3C86_1788480 [compost metagenome]
MHELVRIYMSRDMVNTNQRELQRASERFARDDAHKQGPDQPGAFSHSNGG